MKLRMSLLITASLALPASAMTLEDCQYFIDQWKADIETLFYTVNQRRFGVDHDKFLNKQGSFAVYKRGVHYIYWWNSSRISSVDSYYSSHPNDVYITKWPNQAKDNPEIVKNPTEELYCQKVTHELYNPLFFCCLVDSANKRQKQLLKKLSGLKSLPSRIYTTLGSF